MPERSAAARRLARGRAAFLWACGLDVGVRKPGNVSFASPGHRMEAWQFIDSARAAAGPLFAPGLSPGERIELAVAATQAAVGCNTNLGIVLLCAPVASALETCLPATPAGLREAVRTVLIGLDRDDARAAYRAIALANPGGLGRAEAEDVADLPTLGLRAAMALAAGRDSIARQYANAYADIFAVGLPEFAKARRDHAAAVRAVYLAFLANWPDSHIVRKRGIVAAQTVTRTARAWRAGLLANPALAGGAAFAAWDEALKDAGINPGTSADLTVCTLFAAALTLPGTLGRGGVAWNVYQEPGIGLPPMSGRESRDFPGAPDQLLKEKQVNG